VRRLFDKCRSDRNQHSWELHRKSQRNYRKEVRKASKNTLRTFCSSVNDLPMSARLHGALSRDTEIKLGSLVAPSGRHTQSKAENLELLLITHFPNSEVTRELAAPAAALLTRRSDWRLATRVVTYRSLKVQKWIAYSRPCCKRDGRMSSHTWSEYFVPTYLLAMFQTFGDRLR